MNVSEHSRRSGRGALNFNRQRSLLTMASLAWGVACFVILYSYGEGFGLALHDIVSGRGSGPGADVRRTDFHAGGRRAFRPQDPAGTRRIPNSSGTMFRWWPRSRRDDDARRDGACAATGSRT